MLQDFVTISHVAMMELSGQSWINREVFQKRFGCYGVLVVDLEKLQRLAALAEAASPGTHAV